MPTPYWTHNGLCFVLVGHPDGCTVEPVNDPLYVLADARWRYRTKHGASKRVGLRHALAYCERGRLPKLTDCPHCAGHRTLDGKPAAHGNPFSSYCGACFVPFQGITGSNWVAVEWMLG